MFKPKNIISLVCILSVAIVFGISYFGVGLLLADYVETNPGFNQNEWLENEYLYIVAYVCIASGVLSLLSAGVALRGVKKDSPGTWRMWWGILFALACVTGVGISAFLQEFLVSEWQIYLYIISFFMAACVYYVSTVLFYPVSRKYIPVGASKLRSLCPW